MTLDPIYAGPDHGGKVLKRVVPNPGQRAAAQPALESLHRTGELAQMTAAVDLATGPLAVNQAEAADESLFKNCWRPLMG